MTGNKVKPQGSTHWQSKNSVALSVGALLLTSMMVSSLETYAGPLSNSKKSGPAKAPTQMESPVDAQQGSKAGVETPADNEAYNLTEQQKEQLKALREKSGKQMQALHQQILKQHQELHTYLGQPDATRAGAQTRQDTLSDLMDKAATNRLDMFFEMRRIAPDVVADMHKKFGPPASRPMRDGEALPSEIMGHRHEDHEHHAHQQYGHEHENHHSVEALEQAD